MVRAVIFDCFGVIISDSLEVWLGELRENKFEGVDEIVLTLDAASRGLITRKQSTGKVAGLLDISVTEYLDRIKNGEVKNQQLLDYIAELRTKYKTGLLSNVSIGGLNARFAPDELAKYFDTVVASGEIGYAKPEAQAYEITADRLGVRLNECIFVDDRAEYCQGAQGVGMLAIQYSSFEQIHQELSGFINL